MRIPKSISGNQRLLGLSVVLSLLSGLGSTAVAEQIDMLRTVPLEIKGYEVSKDFPVTFYTADQVLKAIDSSPILLVHMEVLRRGYADLPETEKTKLVTALLKRHQTLENDLPKAFDHGYAQLIYKNNKSGLFYLRKVNDKLQTQFTSLAYGMAQVEADLNHENATPDDMTTRKMDAMYKLGDAVKLNAANQQPGFWPSFQRVLEKVKPMGAYQSFSNRDFTLAVVPIGNNVVPLNGAQVVTIPLKATPEILASNALTTSCNPGGSDSITSSAPLSQAIAMPKEPETPPVASKNVSFNGETAVLQFYSTETPGLARVRVTGIYGQPLLSFETYATNRIVEDLEGDGTFEIVARQYKQDPYNPVMVYRYTPCGFELDKKVFNAFH
jgi:hypothetical protein